MDESQKYAEQKRSDSKEYILGDRIYMNFYESKPMYSDISQISDCLKKRRKEFIKQQQEIVYILTGVLLARYKFCQRSFFTYFKMCELYCI